MTRAALTAAVLLAALAGCRRPEALPPAVAAAPAPVGPGAIVPYPAGATVPPGVGVPFPSGAPVLSGVLTPETIAGTYAGSSQLVRSAGRCGRGGNARLVMRDPVVRWRVDRSVPEIAATVGLDGSFAADNGSTVVRGQFVPGRVDFDAGTALCGYRYSLVKR